MKRDRGPLPVLLTSAGVFGVALALVIADRSLMHGRPTGPQANAGAMPNRPDIPSWTKVETLEGLLRRRDPGLRVVRLSPRSAFCYVCDGDAEPPAAPDAEEYADRWRGVVLCAADWAVTHPDEAARPAGPHAAGAGDFRLFGDVALMGRVRRAVEAFTAYRLEDAASP